MIYIKFPEGYKWRNEGPVEGEFLLEYTDTHIDLSPIPENIYGIRLEKE